ncbi:DNA repair protein RecN [Candidatus Hydrogenisulfobacillus filiaventi]|uniref:DNA repair protein RecN n=1 Tax=Candidatus Hydrogenisulfobacillus filiaventi TaxID=2707344 RepID=A0A6F8ZF87_9FIRM|nr:DNA repair protein RecN [Candidatus Hydrogenisulfobacillus filiaventi]
MLENLAIHNFGIMADSVIDWEPGLNVVTGESGAGKSLLVEALDTVLGARATADRIGPWDDAARIRASFRVGAQHPVWQAAAAWGLEPDEVLIVQREWGRDGRSLFRVQGRPVPAAAVRELADCGLMELSGQHQHQRWLRPHALTGWLDEAGGLEGLRAAVEEAWAAWRQAVEALEELRGQAPDPATVEAWRETVAEIGQAGLSPDEEARLEDEIRRLRAARRLMEGYAAFRGNLEGDGDSPGAEAALAEAARALAALAGVDPALAPAQALLEGALADVEEARRQAGEWYANLDLDPSRLEALEARLDRIARLKRRYGPTVEAVLAAGEEARRRLEAWENRAWEERQAQRREAAAADRYREAAAALAAAREEAARRLEPELQRLVRAMGMEHALVELVLEAAEPGPRGTEEPVLRFSANRGQPLRPFQKVASGGELARLGLALTVSGAGGGGEPLVFDEVDSGTSGHGARQVAALLAALARTRQVIVVSHQAVVASRAGAHYHVDKLAQEGRTRSQVRRLEPAERVTEIARMLSGDTTEASLRHARELLVLAAAGEEDAKPGATTNG